RPGDCGEGCSSLALVGVPPFPPSIPELKEAEGSSPAATRGSAERPRRHNALLIIALLRGEHRIPGLPGEIHPYSRRRRLGGGLPLSSIGESRSLGHATRSPHAIRGRSGHENRRSLVSDSPGC